MNININSNPIQECSLVYREGASRTYFLLNMINENTSAEDFEGYRSFASSEDWRPYRLESEWGNHSALSTAAKCGNIALIRHIFSEGKKEGKNLLNYGDSYGLTPLFRAACSKFPKKGFEGAKELIKLGAKVNLATSSYYPWHDRSYSVVDVPAGSTPLFAACEISQNVELAKLLLEHNGKVKPGILSEKGQKILEKAKRLVTSERAFAFLAGWFKQPDNKDSLVRKLPKEIVKKIFDYARA